MMEPNDYFDAVDDNIDQDLQQNGIFQEPNVDRIYIR